MQSDFASTSLPLRNQRQLKLSHHLEDKFDYYLSRSFEKFARAEHESTISRRDQSAWISVRAFPACFFLRLSRQSNILKGDSKGRKKKERKCLSWWFLSPYHNGNAGVGKDQNCYWYHVLKNQ